jgi:hypothetical protein
LLSPRLAGMETIRQLRRNALIENALGLIIVFTGGVSSSAPTDSPPLWWRW